jgi:methionyl-tRNA formyltransferase
MNITLLVNRDLASNLALNHLLPRLAGQHRLRVFLSDKVGGTGQRPQPLQELQFFEQTLFNALLFPALERGEERGEANEASAGLLTFKQLQLYTAAPIGSLNNINSPDSLEILRQSEPNLIVSVRYGGILREEAIAIPSLGVINLHSGLLPEYRGVMATFRALLNDEPEIGTTLHYIVDSGIDTGPIIEYSTVPVAAGKSYLWHVLRLYPAACHKLAQVIDVIDRGERPAQQPQTAGGQYYSFPTEQELKAFEQSGHCLYQLDEIVELGQQFLGVTPC